MSFKIGRINLFNKEGTVGVVIKADFNLKLSPKLQKFNPDNPDKDYHTEIFCELYPKFPQFKAHVAAFVERNYCTMINDEDHPTPHHVLAFLKPHEISWLNNWIVTRGKPQTRILS